MNLAESKPALIGIDWGTSSLRAFLIDGKGNVLDQFATAQGIMQLPKAEFLPVLKTVIQRWAAEGSLPVLASGMITSKNGWLETPYLQLPAGAEELAAALTRFDASAQQVVHFVTGMCVDSGSRADVMRGEETQLIGAQAQGYGDGLYVLPGTHSKWATINDGRIDDFSTFMTGEVFAAMRDHTILGTLLESDSFDKQGFCDGVEESMSKNSNLLRDLFQVRTQPLLGRRKPTQMTDYLSGLLIGAEIKTTVAAHPTGCINLIGGSELCDRYQLALTVVGAKSNVIAESVVATGHFEIAKAARILG